MKKNKPVTCYVKNNLFHLNLKNKQMNVGKILDNPLANPTHKYLNLI